MDKVAHSNYLIPSGSELRVLLNSEHISYGEVYFALKSKGIFCGKNDKPTTIPLLSSTLLTPSGYVDLIDASVDRDTKPKVKFSALDLTLSDSDWISPLKDIFDSGFLPCENIESVDVVSNPLVIVEGKNKARIPYTINRKDFSKNWLKREIEFSGEIIVERRGNSLRLELSSTHSSKETELINRRITRKVTQVLKEKGITENDEERKITFESFKSVERVRFFKRLTAGLDSKIGKGNVNDMEISLDASAPPLPDDPQVSWMNQTVKRLKIDGDRLNNIFLISEEKYYAYYHVQRMDITYAYSFGTKDGTFRAGFFFSSPNRNRGPAVMQDAEFTFEVLKITHNYTANSEAKKEIAVSISNGLRKMIEIEFDRLAAERD